MARPVYLLIALLTPVTAMAQLIGGNSLSVLVPSGDFSDTHTVGVGFYGNVEFGLTSNIALVGELGWAQWSAEEADGTAAVNEDLNTWSVTGGLKISLLGPLYLEGRTGYYFNDMNEAVFIPALGLRLGKLDINLGMNVLDPVPFLNARIGYFWAK